MTRTMTNNSNKISIQERSRSQAYVNRAKLLLELAEKELISTDGHLISIEGLNKLKQKVDIFQEA
ncbi:MAG: hypothetical protein GY816_03440 [Cytophagales bacterium]|nr:hypothetical protein [Cytophagales bacterium]